MISHRGIFSHDITSGVRAWCLNDHRHHRLTASWPLTSGIGTADDPALITRLSSLMGVGDHPVGWDAIITADNL